MDDTALLLSLGFARPSAREAAESFRQVFPGVLGLGEFSGVWALDGTMFQASDTEENRVEWPYASGPKSGCGFPVVVGLVAHSLVGKGSSILVTAPWKAHDFRLYVEASARFKAGELHVGDRAFCSFTAFAILAEAGADGIFRGKDW